MECCYSMRFATGYFLLVLLSSNSALGQYAFVLRAGTRFVENANMKPALTSFGDLAAGGSYGIAIGNRRIEGHPTLLAYARKGSFSPEAGSFDAWGLWMQFPLSVYPLDFDNSCNCPTFNKQGERSRKGFFIYLAPGIRKSWQRYEGNGDPFRKAPVSYDGELGLGFDLGLNRKSTLRMAVGVAAHFGEYLSLDLQEERFARTSGTFTTVGASVRYLYYPAKRR